MLLTACYCPNSPPKRAPSDRICLSVRPNFNPYLFAFRAFCFSLGLEALTFDLLNRSPHSQDTPLLVFLHWEIQLVLYSHFTSNCACADVHQLAYSSAESRTPCGQSPPLISTLPLLSLLSRERHFPFTQIRTQSRRIQFYRPSPFLST